MLSESENYAPVEPAETGLTSSGSTDALDTPSQLGEITEKLNNSADRIAQLLASHNERDQLIDRLHERIDALQSNQVSALLAPAIHTLVALHSDLLESAGSGDVHADAEAEGSAVNEAAARRARELAFFASRVQDSLEILGANPLGTAPGQPFDSRRHQAVSTEPTAAADHDRTIARVIQDGFTILSAPRPVTFARVVVYRYEEPASPAAGESASTPAQHFDPTGTES